VQNARQGRRDAEARARSAAAQYSICVWFALLFFLGGIALAIVWVAVMNTALLATTGGAFAGTLVMGEVTTNCVTSLDADDKPGINECVSILSTVDQIYVTTLSLLNYALALADYTVGVLQLFLLLALQLLIVVIKFVMGGLLRVPFMALGNMGVQLLLIVVRAASSAGAAMQTQGTGDAFGATVGVGLPPSGNTAVGGGNSNSIVQFVTFFFETIITRFATTFQLLSTGMLSLVNFLFVNGKYAPKLFSILMGVVDYFNPGKLVGKFLYAIFNLHYITAEVSYAFCELHYKITQSLCTLQNSVSGTVNAIAGVVAAACSCHVGRMPSCPQSTLDASKCEKPPQNPVNPAAGVGFCNQDACGQAVTAIIGEVSTLMPTCAYWTPNSSSVVECMSIVYYYSLNETQQGNLATLTGNVAAPISTIGKELCFVLTATVIAQCQSGFDPPWGFNHAATADEICVVDKSGLVPPYTPFNERCACVYQAPLCPYDCCNQYSLHVLGQIDYMIGGLTCATILTEYPEDFWCQFDGATADDVLPQEDYTFSADWCAAYRLFLQPVCSMAPFYVLSAVPGTQPYRDNFAATTCATISNQTGVCQPINATIEPIVYVLQAQRVMASSAQLYASNNAANAAGAGAATMTTFNDNIPTNETAIQDLIRYFLNKFTCQQVSLVYNSSSLLYAAAPDTVNASISAYCDNEISSALFAFELLDETQFLTITEAGQPVQPMTDLAGIPAGVAIFQPQPSAIAQSAQLGAAQTPVAYACPASSGNSVAELSSSVSCSGAVQQNSLTTLASATNSGADALNVMQQTSDSLAPLAHMSPYTGVDPNATNAPLQQEDVTSLNDAAALPTTQQYGLAQNDKPSTSSYIAYDPTEYPPPDGTPLSGAPIYIGITGAGQRVPLAFSGDTPDAADNETATPRRQKSAGEEFAESVEELWRELRVIYTRIVDGIAELQKPTDPGKRSEDVFRRAVDADLEDVRTARTTIASPLYFRRTRRLLAVYTTMARPGSPEYQAHVGTRRVLSTGDSALDELVQARLLQLAAQTSENIGLTQPQLIDYLTLEQIELLQTFMAAMADVVAPRVWDIFWGFVTSGDDDYSFGASTLAGNGTSSASGAGANRQCRATTNNPYKCCQGPNVSPQECCRGLIICFPLLPASLFPAITNHQNVDRIRCPAFNNFFDYWYNLIRTIWTASILIVNGSGGPDYTPLVDGFLNFVAYKDYKFPPYAGGCIFWYSRFLAGLFFAMSILLVIFSVGAISGIAAIADTQYRQASSLEDVLDATAQPTPVIQQPRHDPVLSKRRLEDDINRAYAKYLASQRRAMATTPHSQ
jgi:hypothetical protein